MSPGTRLALESTRVGEARANGGQASFLLCFLGTWCPEAPLALRPNASGDSTRKLQSTPNSPPPSIPPPRSRNLAFLRQASGFGPASVRLLALSRQRRPV